VLGNNSRLEFVSSCQGITASIWEFYICETSIGICGSLLYSIISPWISETIYCCLKDVGLPSNVVKSVCLCLFLISISALSLTDTVTDRFERENRKRDWLCERERESERHKLRERERDYVVTRCLPSTAHPRWRETLEWLRLGCWESLVRVERVLILRDWIKFNYLIHFVLLLYML